MIECKDIEIRVEENGLEVGRPVTLLEAVLEFQTAGDELGATEEEIADALLCSIEMGHIKLADHEYGWEWS